MPQEEAAYKLCKVKRNQFGKGAVPFLVTHDGRTIRYPDPDIKVGLVAKFAAAKWRLSSAALDKVSQVFTIHTIGAVLNIVGIC